ncbi:MAG TPA: hypothetical protein DCL38_04625, partial [Lachnospiraceae bacterium]|nr:hypothetical protein [Lachnospiraceae bacterium]
MGEPNNAVNIQKQRRSIAGDVNIKKNMEDVKLERVQSLKDIDVKAMMDKKTRSKGFVNIKEQEYYDHIFSSSKDENLKLKIKTEEVADGDWQVISWPKAKVFKQKLAVATRESKWSSKEEKAISTAKKTFRNADVCTIRERDAMNKYLSENFEGGEGPAIEGENEVGDPALMEYVNSINSFEISEEILTDDYMSKHIAELYELRRKLQMFDQLKLDYPQFFDGLNEEARMKLQAKVNMAEDLGNVIDTHLELHGVQINEDEGTATLMTEDRDKTVRHAKRAERKTNFETARNHFFNKYINDEQVNIAQSYTAPGVYDDAQISMDTLGFILAEKEEAMELFNAPIKTAMNEMKKTFAVRDELLAKQKENLNKLRKTRGEEKIAALKNNITRLNRRLQIVNQHAGYYREFIDLATGTLPMVSKQTVDFLTGEGHKDMMEIISFKALGDCLETSLVAVDRVKVLEKIEGLREKNTPEAKKEISKLEKELADGMQYVKMPADAFIARYREYKEAKKTAKHVQGVIKNANARRDKSYENSDAKVEEYNKKYGKTVLKKHTDRIMPAISDPFGKWENLDGLSLAMNYGPTPDMPEELRQEIINKNIMPFLNELLQLTPEDMDKMKCPEKPDVDSEEYWKNKSMAFVGADMKTFLDNIRAWGVELSDEHYIHLKTAGETLQSMVVDYEKYDQMEENPLFVLVKGHQGLYEKAEDIGGIFNRWNEHGDELVNEEEKALQDYLDKNLGIKISTDKIRSANVRQEKYRLVPDYMDLLTQEVAFKKATRLGAKEGETVAGIYAQKKKRNEDELAKLKTVTDPLKSLVPEETRELTESARKKLKLNAQRLDKNISTAYRTSWAKIYGKGEASNQLLKSLNKFLRKVEFDANGSPRVEYWEAYQKNQRDLSDMVSEDVQVRNQALIRIGKEMAEFKFPNGMSNANIMLHFDSAQHWEVREKLSRVQGFMELYKKYENVFEGEGLSAEEKEKLNLNILRNPLIKKLIDCMDVIAQSSGSYADGTDIEIPANLKDTAAKKAYLQGKMLESTQEAQKLFDEAKQAAVVQGRRRSYVKEKREEVNKLSDFIAKLDKLNQEEIDKFNKIEDAAGKNKAVEAYSKKFADYLTYSDNLKKFVKTLDPSVLTDEAKLFAYNNGIKLFDPEEIETAEFNVEKKNMSENYVYTNDEDVKNRVMVRKVFGNRDMLTDEQNEKWRKKYGGGGTIDVRSFWMLLDTVKRDIFGNVLPEYQEASKRNNELFEDFVSGEPEKMQKTLHKIAQNIMTLEFPPEQTTREYFEEHKQEVLQKNVTRFAFMNFYATYKDYFESDAFTEEERTKLRRIMDDNGMIDSQTFYLGQWQHRLGLEDDKNMLVPNDITTAEARAEWANGRIKQADNMIQSSYMLMFGEDTKKQRSITGAYVHNNDKIGALSRLAAGKRGKSRLITERLKALGKNKISG